MDTLSHLFGRANEAIRHADRVLLIAHKKPDGDTLGSSSAVLNWLIREGKTPTAFCADLPSPSFRYLDNIHLYTNDPQVFDAAYDLVIVFDSGDLRYAGVHEHFTRLPAGHTLLNIDHHVTNERYGHLNIVIPDASSTAEIVYRFFEENSITLDDRMATSLLTGLYTDTSNFSNAATTPFAIEAASKLMAAGARHLDILRHLLHDKPIDVLRIWGILLSRLRHNPKLDVASTYLLRNDVGGGPTDIADGLANFLNGVVGGTDTLMVLRELPNGQVRGSFRSVKRDISKLAKLFGGGGHKKAAGFTVTGRIQETPEGPRITAL
jgi:phosphoesterase RecJ-like protein